MSTEHYKKSIVVTVDARAAYNALTVGMEHWWTKPDAPVQKVGDKAKFPFPPGVSYWTFEATKLVPEQCVEMQCVDAFHKHEGQPEEIEKEWLGTKTIFTIEKEGDKTRISLEHVGLQPKLHCYDICEAGWDFFFLESLQAYLEAGEGKPHRALA